MSKEMENHSFNERNSLTGNSGHHFLMGLRPKLQPVRIKTLQDMYGSDEDDSEDKDKESDSEPDSDDIQPLPDDDEVQDVQRPVESSNKQSNSIDPLNSESNKKTTDPQLDWPVPLTPIPEVSSTVNSLHFTDNFVINEETRCKNRKSSEVTTETEIPVSHSGFSSSLTAHSNRRSNIKMNLPQPLYPLNENSFQSVAPFKLETTHAHSIKEQIKHRSSSTFEAPVPPRHYSNERVSHSLSEPAASSTFAHQPPNSASNHLVTDTPHKNNPIHGSMRPTLSTSHRSMFQTPQSLKLHQDYGKNVIHTPATIFGNWSQKHMTQTPLQCRVTTNDTTRASGSSILGQRTSKHETPWFKGSESKGARRPLAETMLSSQHSQNDNLPVQYIAESCSVSKNNDFVNNQNREALEIIKDKTSNKSSVAKNKDFVNNQNHEAFEIIKDKTSNKSSVSKNNDFVNNQNRETLEIINDKSLNKSSVSKSNDFVNQNREALEIIKDKSSNNSSVSKNNDFVNNQNREALEIVKDKSSNKSSVRVENEFKENRHPEPIENSVKNEEKSAISKNPGSTRDSIRSSINRNENINCSETRHDVGSIKTFENQVPQSSFQASYTKLPKPIETTIAEKEENKPAERNHIQLSMPSNIKRLSKNKIITVKGREYLILGSLGEGMSGTVLRVQDVASQELRAIKCVNLRRMDQESAQGCLEEIALLHRLQAPCVVRMFDHEIEFPMVHVVLEMGDTDLSSLLKSMSQEKRLPLTMILYYWTEMLTAVRHIHDNGVIHSDLKPANFLLVRGRLKLIDFGIASSMNGDMTSVVKNCPIGTLNYISPEALLDIGGNSDSPNHNVKYKITFKSDVWSLGCILYSLVYGYTPFHNIRPQCLKINAITNPNPKISFPSPTGKDVERIPPILIDVIRKCLQHDPKSRPTVAQLLQIPYIPVKQNSSVANIPPNILVKIKNSLTESEWRQFTEGMEAR